VKLLLLLRAVPEVAAQAGPGAAPGTQGRREDVVDWAGARIPVHAGLTGQPWQAPLFVAVLGASSYTYAQATRDQQMEAWIQARIQALEFFGGAPT
jgi:transposase